MANQGTCAEVFSTFLRLGLTSFGGPIAHLGYFRDELVLRRRWLDEENYAGIVALCQFLPGPASSQVGFALGVLRGGGLAGGFAAWLGFTLPSALILFASGAIALAGSPPDGLLRGLKLVAVAVVAQAVIGMASALTRSRVTIAIAMVAAVLSLVLTSAFGQVAAIALGALAGLWLCRSDLTVSAAALRFPVSRQASVVALVLFAMLLIVPPFVAGGSQAVALFNAFYRSGALVFGGGHVVLPLLQAETVATGWITNQTFLVGYGLAQAMPGPLFTFAAYLGAVMGPSPNGAAGAVIALIAVFSPGLLLVYGMLPFWHNVRSRTSVQAAMRGANAAVVGILAAALFDPLWTNAVHSLNDVTLVLAGFLLLVVWKSPAWIVVILMAGAGLIGI